MAENINYINQKLKMDSNLNVPNNGNSVQENNEGIIMQI